ncbi:MAG: F0F1 ATP synthase subunit epsilon [Acidobacteria bacterium]|nr:F0F1 ATP synthase subunit epsilon [Acidobacteriota bacterium]
MAEAFLLEVATPDRLLIREEVSEIQVPAANGYLGLLPGHSPLLSELGTGELSYAIGGHRHSVSLDGGWVEVLPDHVRVLANTAERASEIDAKRAADALQRAAERLSHPELGIDIARALNALHRAQARLDTAKHP